jgi:hypothetical protein
MKTPLAYFSACLLAFGLALVGCSKSEPQGATLKQMPAGKEYSGFLSSYDKLKQSQTFENTMSYVNPDDAKNIHNYIAIIIDPVELYASTNADVSKIPDLGRTAVKDYFENAIKSAVADAFPVVTEPGPLVLRLRSALIGVDAGEGGADGKADVKPDRALNIRKVGVEMELVDSQTGEQIAAAVDHQNFGEDASTGPVGFWQAFDNWAGRLRAFLDTAHELTPEQAAHAVASYHPYDEESAAKQTAKK